MTGTEAAERDAVVAEALEWIGTPYHHRGRIKGAGTDCGMFLAEVFNRAGVLEYVDPGEYPHDWHLHRGDERYLALVQAYCRKTTAPRPGDIALFRFGRVISHGAIVLEWPRIVHSYVGIGVTLDDAEANLDLRARFEGTWTPWGDA